MFTVYLNLDCLFQTFIFYIINCDNAASVITRPRDWISTEIWTNMRLRPINPLIRRIIQQSGVLEIQINIPKVIGLGFDGQPDHIQRNPRINSPPDFDNKSVEIIYFSPFYKLTVRILLVSSYQIPSLLPTEFYVPISISFHENIPRSPVEQFTKHKLKSFKYHSII